MSTISKLKRVRSDLIAKVNEAVEKDKKGSYEDKAKENIWSPAFDKAKGTCFARIRFLPQKDPEAVPFVKIMDAGFQGPSGKWYIENCLKSLGQSQADPLSELRNRLYNSGIEADKKVAEKYKIRKNYYANILVISDPTRKENEGKVFKYRFGPVVFEMIQDALKPKFDTDKPINPFDLWEGADLELKLYMKDDYWKYDRCSWAAPSEVGKNDADKEKIIEQCFDLSEFTAPTRFKTYEELSKKLVEVLGQFVGSGIEVATPGNETSRPAPSANAAVSANPLAATPAAAPRVATPPAPRATARVEAQAEPEASEDESDEEMFRRLAQS